VPDGGDRAVAARERLAELVEGRARCEPRLDAERDAGRVRESLARLARAQERARDHGGGGVGKRGEPFAELERLSSARGGQLAQLVGIAGGRLGVAAEVDQHAGDRSRDPRSKAHVRKSGYNVGVDDRRLGRAAFLGLVGVGVAGLFYGRDATKVVGGVVPSPLKEIVPTSGWRIYSIGRELPRLDPNAFRLTIAGAVERPVTYSLADLRALPQVTQVSDFHCVTGWSVYDVTWKGVRFRQLLAEAGVRPQAKALRFVSAEVPYDDTLTLEQAYAADALLALELDGKPLSVPHGFPARVVMPRMYGYKSVKWVSRIEVEPHLDTVGYWEQRGYDEDAWVGASN
jgi:hypothetical protein